MTQIGIAFREWLEGHAHHLWSEDIWPRAFWFDVFLSHRRSDWSRAFADALTAAGLVVYHDNDVAVRDALVEFELHGALQNSRYVLVCVSPGLDQSLYVRAEYLPALAQSEQSGVPRVLVAVRGNAPIPSELASSPRFRADVAAEVAALVELLREGNRVALPATRPAERLQPSDAFAPVRDAHLAPRRRWRPARRRRRHRDRTAALRRFSLDVIGAWAAAVLDGTDESLDDQLLGVARVILDVGAERRRHDYIWRCAFVMMYSRVPDARRIGAELFLWVARKGHLPREDALLAQLVWRETDRGGYADVCAELLDRMAVRRHRDDQAVERALVCFPFLFSTALRRALADRLPPGARAKLGISGLDRTQVPVAERVRLIGQVVQHLHNQAMADRDSLSLVDIEQALHDVRKLRAGSDADQRHALLDLYQCLTESTAGAAPLAIRLELPALVNLVFEPLAALLPVEAARVQPMLRTIWTHVEASGFTHVAALMRRTMESGDPPSGKDVQIALIHDSEYERCARKR